MANNFGPTLAFLFALPIGDSARRFPYLLYAEALLGVLCLLVFLIHFPEAPKTPPSQSASLRQKQEKEGLSKGDGMLSSVWSYAKETLAVLKNRSFLCLAVAGGTQAGIFNSW